MADVILLSLAEILIHPDLQWSCQIIEPEDIDPPYSYFTRDRIELDGKFYKLIWLLEDHQIYIGVVNAYRR